jgi:soluble lytic murein transglycosylase-like protein
MSRGAQQTTRNLTDQQLAQQNQAISQESQSDSQDRSLLMPTIQSLLNSQGYIPQQQSAINQQSLGASNTAFNALQEKAANRTAATNNSAGAAHPLGEFEWPPPLKLSPSRVRSRLPGLDPALVCSVVEQESAWDAHAIRYEPAFRVR